jgi:hypothetical protein
MIAQKILDVATTLGWKVYVGYDMLTIEKHFTPNDNEGFITCDMEYWDILSLLPTTSPGSTWGTDGSGIGALSAMRYGCFRMNKSGGSIRVLNALKKLLDKQQ